MRKSLNIPDNAIVGLFINRLHYFKDIDSLVYFINHTQSDIHWIIIGDGNERKKIDNILMKKTIHYLKSVKHEELDCFYQIADFFVNFNILSTKNNPNFEALKNHLPIFTVRRGYGCDDINNLLICEDNVETLSKVFNEKYYYEIINKGDQIKDMINRMKTWEMEKLVSWEERNENEYKYLINRLKCGKK